MGLFDFFRKNKTSNQDVTLNKPEVELNEIVEEFDNVDYLGKAASAGTKAKQAVKNKKYDKAWKLFHEQKEMYAMHANRSGFTARQALALDSQVHEELGNILRAEGKHLDAFNHILYWVCCNNNRPIQKHEQKLTAYFNRCKLKNVSLDTVINYSLQQWDEPYTFLQARDQVAQWSLINN
ncbi:hypothetical protein L3I74_004477 [Vibrio parahaemolyticus]|nr:hypothetical protein [Vibrio parahaemolyticus]EIU7852597.1 hypothetical protein [Vibrio parahaemolyticus]EJI1427457.1 hypothetical protein [Vibrio parahaemolyticus]ELA9435237.1 hypothetical protein [Vibrio parahaemolyticus]